jgi:acyl-CoA thioesterase-1
MNDYSFSLGRRRWVTAAASVLTIAALSLWRPAGASAPRTLLVLGDSLSAEYGLARGTGWVAQLEQRLAQAAPGWTVVNASISGETTAGGATRIAGLLDKHGPAAVIVELGGNDALRGLDLNATRDNLDRIVGASQKAGAKVLVLGMRMPPNYGRAYTEAFEKMFRDVAKSHRAPLVPFFLDGIAERIELFQPDRIHPNENAQPKMLDNVWPALKALLGIGQR